MRKTSVHDRLAVALRLAREKAGLSQRDMAGKLDTNQTAISFIEQGDQYVRVIDLVEWCAVTGDDPIEVLREAMDGT